MENEEADKTGYPRFTLQIMQSQSGFHMAVFNSGIFEGDAQVLIEGFLNRMKDITKNNVSENLGL